MLGIKFKKIKQLFKRKKKLIKDPRILIPLITILVGILIITAVFLIINLEQEPEPTTPNGDEPNPIDPEPKPDSGLKPGPADPTLKPQPGEPWEECKQIEYNPEVDYNFVGSLDFIEIEPNDKVIEIKKNGSKKIISLGKFRLPLEKNTILAIPTVWLYFFSEKLSDRDDKLYALENSYLSKIIFKQGKVSREINIGKGKTHSFIELVKCPIGNVYPVNYETYLDFEFLLEIECNNIQNNTCLDNEGKSLEYMNNADLLAKIRVFASSFQDFTKDIYVYLNFKY